MKLYKNLSGRSGVYAYTTGRDNIIIQFREDGTYLYDHHTPGRDHVEKMKKLAEKGKGLSTYISRFVRENYAKKLE